MLKKHCGCHHQFLASSQLLSTNHLTALAPTSDYFQLLLKTIVTILDNVDELKTNSLELMSEWICDVLTTAAKSYHHELQMSPEFDAFLRAVLATERSAILECFLQHLANAENSDSVYPIVLKKLDANDVNERNAAVKHIGKLSPLAINWLPKMPTESIGQPTEVIR